MSNQIEQCRDYLLRLNGPLALYKIESTRLVTKYWSSTAPEEGGLA